MKIFAAGIATETNTFCAIPTGREDFLVQRGRDVLQGRIDHPTLDLSATWAGRPRHGAMSSSSSQRREDREWTQEGRSAHTLRAAPVIAATFPRAYGF